MPLNIVYSAPVGTPVITWGDGALSTPVPTLATLSGLTTATAGIAHTSTVTFNAPADQTYTITWARSNGGTGDATSTITAGNLTTSTTTTWLASGFGRTVGFSISPSVTTSGSPVTVAVAGTATLQTLSGSTTGTTAVATTFTVTLNGQIPLGGGTTTITAPGATLSTSTLTWVDGGALSQTFTATRATDGTTSISITNSMGLANSSAISYATLTIATTATIILPSTGTTAQPTTGTVVLNGIAPVAGTVTLVGSGATFTPASLSWALSESGAAKSFTIQRAADGVTTYSSTNTMGLSNLGGGSYTSSTSSGSSVAAGSRSFTLTSASTQTAPFALGFAFRQSDIPTGVGIAITGATAQATVKNTWPDGSVKFAIIAGSASLTAATPLTVRVGQGTASTGTAISLGDLQGAIGTVTIDAAAFGAASWTGADWASAFQTLVSGHRMSSWVFRKAVGSDPHLVAWLEVRMFLGGAIEVLPWVESGFLTGAGPANKSAVYTVTIGGTSRFSATVDVKHHTRIPLLSGGALSYWLGTDPAVTFAHDADYMMSTGLVPHYGWGAPSTSTLNALLQVYTPNTLAGISSAMGAAGSSAALLQNQHALYLTSSGDVRAWKAAQVFGYSGGSWSNHYRDATTNHLPRFQDYPSASLQGGSPSIGAGTGGENGNPVTTHQPSFGYLPYLMTGRWWFLEEQAFWATYNHFSASVDLRRGWTAYATAPYLYADGRNGIIDPRGGPYSNRGGHWSMRTLVQTLTILPSTHSCFADYVANVEANADFYKQVFVDGSHSPGWVSPQGFLGDYSSGGNSAYGNPGGSTAWWGAAWMSAFGVQAWGFASNLGLPISSAAAAKLVAVRNQAYKQVTTRAGDGLGGNYNWRRFGVYDYPIGSDGVGVPVETWWTGAQSYAEYVSARSLATLAPTAGLSLKDHSNDVDMAPGSSTASDYGAFALSGLAYAVDHGAPGANAGWLRVSGASNFNSGFAGLIQNPAHGIRPQSVLPSFVPEPGFYADLPASSSTTMNSARSAGRPTGEQAGPLTNWSTGRYLPDVGEYGAYVIYGSGHLSPGEPLYDDILVRPLDGVSGWQSRSSHTAMIEGGGPPGPTSWASTYGDYFASIQTGSVGWPYPGHQYTGLVVQTVANGGAAGWGNLYTVMLGGWGGTNPRAVYRFNLDSPSTTPTRVINDIGITGSGNSYPCCAVDHARGGWWTLNYNGNGPLAWTDFATHTTTLYPGSVFNVEKDFQMEWVPELSALVAQGGGPGDFRVKVNIVTAGVPSTWVDVTVTGTENPNALSGLCWCPLLRKFASYNSTVNGGASLPADINQIHWLTPPTTNITSGTWVRTKETFAGQGGASIYSVINTNNGLLREMRVYSKFIWVEKLRCFVFPEGLDGPVKLWRPLGT